MKPDDRAWSLERLSAADAPELCRAIDAAKQQLPSAREMAALAASLSLQGLPVPGQESARASLGVKPALTKYWLGIGAGVVGASAIWLLLARRPVGGPPPATLRPSSAPIEQGRSAAAARSASKVGLGASGPVEIGSVSPEPTESDAFAAEPPAPSIAAPSEASPSRATGAPVSDPDGTSSRRSSAASRTSTSQSPSASARGASVGAGSKARPSEIELLRDARLALRSSPALALGLTEQHGAWYPHGAMIQERELIAISALAQLGRHAAVLARAQRFEQEFPNSPYRKQISKLAE